MSASKQQAVSRVRTLHRPIEEERKIKVEEKDENPMEQTRQNLPFISFCSDFSHLFLYVVISSGKAI
jgi:hypothetical protein